MVYILAEVKWEVNWGELHFQLERSEKILQLWLGQVTFNGAETWDLLQRDKDIIVSC